MFNSKKGQVSVEFMMLIGFLFLVFIIFIMVISNRMVSMREERTVTVLENVGQIIESEVKLAENVKGGYERKEFELPPYVDGKLYLVEKWHNPGFQIELRIKYDPSLGLDEEYILTLPINTDCADTFKYGDTNLNTIKTDLVGNIFIN